MTDSSGGRPLQHLPHDRHSSASRSRDCASRSCSTLACPPIVNICTLLIGSSSPVNASRAAPTPCALHHFAPLRARRAAIQANRISVPCSGDGSLVIPRPRRYCARPKSRHGKSSTARQTGGVVNPAIAIPIKVSRVACSGFEFAGECFAASERRSGPSAPQPSPGRHLLGGRDE